MSDEKIPVRWCRCPGQDVKLYCASGKDGRRETASNLHSLAWALHVPLDRFGERIEDPMLFEEHLRSEPRPGVRISRSLQELRDRC
jgi:hypothetical protein